MSEQRIASALTFFFQEYLSTAQRNTLQQQQAGIVELRRGAYRAYTGDSIETNAGVSITPDFSIEVSQNTIALSNGAPETNNIAMGSTANRIPLVWLRDLADIAVDTSDEIQRIMHNINYYMGENSSQNASAWAQAITNHPNRSSLTQNLFEYTEVPQEFIHLTNHLSEFRHTLYHFFTFNDEGEYFERWEGSGRTSPDNLSATYKDMNIAEFKLEQYDGYIYAVVPTTFLQSNPRQDESGFREVVWGFQWGGSDGNTPTNVRVLHTVAKSHENVGDYFDFVCFEAEDGLGVSMPVSARGTINDGLAAFLMGLPDEEEADARNTYLRHSSTTTSNDSPMVMAFASVDSDVTLPDGVESTGEGSIRTLLIPPNKVVEVGANDHVHELNAPRLMAERLTNVHTDVQYTAMDTAIAAADASKRGGAGTIVGIIDGGIDGTHPAFSGRIHSFWNQWDTTGPTPAASIPNTLSNFLDRFFFDHGTELTGSNVSNAVDWGGHGTHVAGIAAGAEVTSSNPVPPGMAPNATIIAATTRSPEEEFTSLLNDFDVYSAARYIFYKAGQIGSNTPAVVNMSIGTHDHPHDKTDILSRALDELIKNASGEYLPGKILVAAAGNERNDNIHLHRNVGAGSSETLSFDFTGYLSRLPREVITIWVTNSSDTNTTLDASVETKRPSPSTVTTGQRTQQATASPVWNHYYTLGVHVGTVFGPKNPTNNDFNIRVMFVSAFGLIPDASGTITVGTNKYSLTRLDENGNRLVNGVNIKDITGAIHVPLGNPVINRRWDIILRNNSSSDMEMHAWAGNECANFTNAQASDNNHKICVPAESSGVVSVASCDTGSAATAGAISSFSSPGKIRKHPTENGIDITAPGNPIVSAQTHTPSTAPASNTTTKGGTSMASPCIASLVANILAEEPTLTLTQLRTRLARCSIPTIMRDGTTNLTGPNTADDWGKGLIEAIKLRR